MGALFAVFPKPFRDWGCLIIINKIFFESYNLHRRLFTIFHAIHINGVDNSMIFIYSFIAGHIQRFMFVVVAIFIKFFGHVQRFWSYSFGHIDSVMLTPLFLGGGLD